MHANNVRLCPVGNYPNTLHASARRSHKLQITSPTPVHSLALQTGNPIWQLANGCWTTYSAQVCCWQTREDVFKRELPKSVSREGVGMCDVSQSSNRNNLPLKNNRKRSDHLKVSGTSLASHATRSARKPTHNPPPSAGQLLSGADSDKHPSYLCHRL